MLLSDYINQVQQLVHDTSSLDFSTSDLTFFINEARKQVARDFWCVRKYFAPLNLIPNQEIYPMSGGIGGAQVITGGSGYSANTAIAFTPTVGGAVVPTAVPVISNGVITSITMTSWGSGYNNFPIGGLRGIGVAGPIVTGTSAGLRNQIQLQLSVPITNLASGIQVFVANVGGTVEANGLWTIDVTFPNLITLRGSQFVNAWTSGGSVNAVIPFCSITDSGGGSGASASTANSFMNNVLDIFTVSCLFGNSRCMLQWSPYSVFNAFLRQNATWSGRPGVWSGYNEQNQFYICPALPDQAYPIEIDAYILPSNLVNTTDNDTQVNQPADDVVQWWAAHLALLKSQNFEQAEYYAKKYDAQAKKVGLSRFAPRKPNPYQTNWRRVQRGYF